MIWITSEAGAWGPFNSVEALNDRYVADGLEYQFDVIGASELVEEQPPTEAPAPEPTDLPALRQRLIAAVDTLIAGIYQRWMRFETEYTAREEAARAYVAAEYEGDPGVWVSAFATAARMTNEAATDLIIMQADGLRAALAQLGALRMRKYEIALATDAETAQTAHDDIIALATAIAAGL